MAYIEKEPIIEFITKGLNNPDKTKAFGYDAIEILTEIEYAPTADVVPKSDVERLEKENETLIINMNAYGLAAKRLAEEKSEVARKIFARVRKAFYDVSSVTHNQLTKAVRDDDQYQIDLLSGIDNVLRAVRAIIEEFAKEYTEGENEDKRGSN